SKTAVAHSVEHKRTGRDAVPDDRVGPAGAIYIQHAAGLTQQVCQAKVDAGVRAQHFHIVLPAGNDVDIQALAAAGAAARAEQLLRRVVELQIDVAACGLKERLGRQNARTAGRDGIPLLAAGDDIVDLLEIDAAPVHCLDRVRGGDQLAADLVDAD